MNTEKLYTNKADITSQYFDMALKNYGNYNNNTDIISQIVLAINSNLAELNNIQNQLSKLNNLNQESLIKQDQLLRIKNDDLMNQLRKLEEIQSSISNKDRIIDQTNLNISNQELNIKVLIISIVLALLLFGVILLYFYSILGEIYTTIIVIIIIICYIILLMYSYNVFYFKDAMTYFSNNNVNRIASKLNSWSDTINTDLRNDIYGLESSWVNNNCSCPDNQSEEEPPIYSEVANVVQKEIPGHFYYDGTAPQQLLVPAPLSPKLNDNIEWVDYSSNGTVHINQRDNNISYNDSNYYNFKNKENPQHLYDQHGYLVNNKTKTSNL